MRRRWSGILRRSGDCLGRYLGGSAQSTYPLFMCLKLWFRPYGGSLLANSPKSNQKLLAPPLGPSLVLGISVIRHLFGGPPRRAIHDPARLNRHPCRFARRINIEFRPAWFYGAPKIKSQIKSRRGDPVGASLLARPWTCVTGHITSRTSSRLRDRISRGYAAI